MIPNLSHMVIYECDTVVEAAYQIFGPRGMTGFPILSSPWTLTSAVWGLSVNSGHRF